MQNIKVILTVVTEGATLKREEVSSSLFSTSKNKKNSINTNNTHRNLVAIPVKQVIKLTEDFYLNALSTPIKPFNKKDWSRLGKSKRIEAHLNEYML